MTTAAQAFALTEELLADMELRRVPLANCFLKGCRLARLIGDAEMLQVFQWELEGFPSTPKGITPDGWAGCVRAKRVFDYEDEKTKEIQPRAYNESVEVLEMRVDAFKTRLELAQDQSVSIASANPNQYVHGPINKVAERQNVTKALLQASERVAARRAFLYSYVLERNAELRVSAPVEDVFADRRAKVDRLLGTVAPEELRRIDSIAANLSSDNPEDWANAVHSCRRLLQALADELYPARDPLDKIVGGKQRKILLGSENYINRLVAFCEEKQNSTRFTELVGSNLAFMGDRLDASFNAAQKGSHSNVTQDEASRTVVFTYLLIGDILDLKSSADAASQETDAEQSDAENPGEVNNSESSIGKALEG